MLVSYWHKHTVTQQFTHPDKQGPAGHIMVSFFETKKRLDNLKERERESDGMSLILSQHFLPTFILLSFSCAVKIIWAHVGDGHEYSLLAVLMTSITSTVIVIAENAHFCIHFGFIFRLVVSSKYEVLIKLHKNCNYEQ